jgi:hypothetical protein
MTKSTTQAAFFILSALVTLGAFAGVNAIAAHEFVAADERVMALADATQMAAIQRVEIIGHRVAKA